MFIEWFNSMMLTYDRGDQMDDKMDDQMASMVRQPRVIWIKSLLIFAIFHRNSINQKSVADDREETGIRGGRGTSAAAQENCTSTFREHTRRFVQWPGAPTRAAWCFRLSASVVQA